MKYPKTAAAIENAQADQWAIADALLEEVGPPSPNQAHDGSGARFKECADELKADGHVGSHGEAWKPETLRHYRDVAAMFPHVKRLTSAAWSVHLIASQVEDGVALLALLHSCVDGARPKSLLPPAIAQFSYRGTYRDLPWVINDRGRVAVNDVMLASGQRRMHEGGKGKKSKTTASDAVQTQADEVKELLANPEVRERVKADVAEEKDGRKKTAVIKAWEAEDEARRVEAEKEEQRIAETARKQIGKSRDYWPELQRQIDAFTKLVGTYTRDFDDLPSPQSHELRLLDTTIANLRAGLDRLETKLHPGGKNRLRQGHIIDVQLN